eukprot:gene2952-4962_t
MFDGEEVDSEYSDLSEYSMNEQSSQNSIEPVQMKAKKSQSYNIFKKIKSATNSRKNSASSILALQTPDVDAELSDIKNLLGAMTPVNEVTPNQPIRIGNQDHFVNIDAHKDTVWKLLEKDGNIYSCSSDGTVKIHSIKTHEHEKTYTCPTEVHSMCLTNQEDKILACLSNGQICIHKNGNLKPKYIMKAHTARITSSSNSYGDLMVTGSTDFTVKLWHIKKKKNLFTFNHQDDVSSVSISDKFFGSSSFDQTVRIFDLETCKNFHTFTGKNSFTCCSFLKENIIIVGDEKGRINLYDLRDGDSTVREFDCQHHQVNSLVAHSNFSMLASASINNAIYLYSMTDGTKIEKLEGHTDAVRSLISLGEELVSGSDDGTIKFWKS